MEIEETPVIEDVENPWLAIAAQGAVLDNELNPPTVQVGEIETTKTESEIDTAELLAPVIAMTAVAFAPNWQITQDESAQLAAVYAPLIDKYLPDNPAAKYGLEITAVMTTVMILAARKGMPMKLEEKQVNEPEMVEEKQVNEPVDSDVYVDTNLANAVDK